MTRTRTHVTLPKSLHDFAMQEALEEAQKDERAEPNFSGYLAKLIREAKERKEQEQLQTKGQE